jgi:hypothetical protein
MDDLLQGEGTRGVLRKKASRDMPWYVVPSAVGTLTPGVPKGYSLVLTGSSMGTQGLLVSALIGVGADLPRYVVPSAVGSRTQGVPKRYSLGTHWVLTGYSQGTQGYSRNRRGPAAVRRSVGAREHACGTAPTIAGGNKPHDGRLGVLRGRVRLARPHTLEVLYCDASRESWDTLQVLYGYSVLYRYSIGFFRKAVLTMEQPKPAHEPPFGGSRFAPHTL